MCIPKSAAAFMAAAIFCMAFSFTVSAQQGTPDTGDGKSFSSQNWYISASVGEQWLLKGSQNGWHFVGKLNAGTWFDSWNGIKINAQGGSRKLAGNSSALYFSTMPAKCLMAFELKAPHKDVFDAKATIATFFRGLLPANVSPADASC